LGALAEAAGQLPDKREKSNALKYEMRDIVMSAFAVFYFQHPSLLNFQEAMKEKRKRSNLETLFGVTRIPKADQVRNILDEVEPAGLHFAFDKALEVTRESGILESYRVLNGTIPVAMDGAGNEVSAVLFVERDPLRPLSDDGAEDEGGRGGDAVLPRHGGGGHCEAWQAGDGAAADT